MTATQALKLAWKLATSRPAVALGAAVVAIVLGGECHSFREEARQEATPAPAPPTDLEQRAEVAPVPCEGAPGGVLQTLEPGKRDRRRLAETYRRPELEAPSTAVEKSEQAGGLTLPDGWLASQILGERELPKLPEGGTALVTLEADGRVEVTVAPRPRKFFDWRSTWEIGGLYGRGQDGEERARGWVAVEPTRAGRIRLRLEAGADLRAGTSDAYVMAGAVWRSKT